MENTPIGETNNLPLMTPDEAASEVNQILSGAAITGKEFVDFFEEVLAIENLVALPEQSQDELIENYFFKKLLARAIRQSFVTSDIESEELKTQIELLANRLGFSEEQKSEWITRSLGRSIADATYEDEVLDFHQFANTVSRGLNCPDNTVAESGYYAVLEILSMGKSENTKQVIDQFTLDKTEAVRRGIIQGIKAMVSDNSSNWVKIKSLNELKKILPESYKLAEQNDEVQQIAQRIMEVSIVEGKYGNIKRLAENVFTEESLRKPEIIALAQRAYLAFLENPTPRTQQPGTWIDVANLYALDEDFLLSEQTKDVARLGIKNRMRQRDDLEWIDENYQFSAEQLKSLAKEVVVDAINKGSLFHVVGLAIDYELDEALETFADQLIVPLREVVTTWRLTTLIELQDFCEQNSRYIELLCKTPEETALLTREEVIGADQGEEGEEPVVKQLHLQLVEAEILKRNGVNLQEIAAQPNEAAFKEIYEILVASDEEWQEPIVREMFMLGATGRDNLSGFGFRRMFRYLDREGMSRHEGLHNFDKVMDLYQSSKLKPKQFFGRIMTGVIMDGREYQAGSAQAQLGTIATNLDMDFGKIKDLAERYQHIDEIKDLVNVYSDTAQIFHDWLSLQRYADMQALLLKTEILDQLVELKESGQDKLYNFIKTIVLHPDSKVDIKAALEFWREPGKFLASRDAHTPDKVQDRKKPSNYLDMPHLDLSADQLRDALVEGVLDKIQRFPPVKVDFEIPLIGGELVTSVRELTSRILVDDSLGGNIGDQLRADLERILINQGVDLDNYLTGTGSPDLDEKVILELLKNRANEFFQERCSWIKFRARIGHKSDPTLIIAGDDTATCDRFGSGKNAVYSFNPNAGKILVEVEREDDSREIRFRTAAQSVITEDVDVGRLIAEIETLVEHGETRLDKILPEQILKDQLSILGIDNIETKVAWQKLYQKVIESIYQTYFNLYVPMLGNSFDQNRVVIGTNYTKILKHLPKTPNNFAPRAPVAYSDKLGEEVLEMSLQRGADLKAFITDVTTEDMVEPDLVQLEVPGISHLNPSDTLAASYLEGKAYDANPNLMTYMHYMENVLIAKEINNTAKNRPDLCFKYVDDTGMRGYLIAYEGEFDSSTPSEIIGQNGIYVMDIATVPDDGKAGLNLIKALFINYKTGYIDKGNELPIYAEFRETTSYKLVENNGRLLKGLLRRWGIDGEFEVVEVGVEQKGIDTMHKVVIKPLKLNPESRRDTN